MNKIITYKLGVSNSYQINYREIAGTKYIVVPVSMMVPGVHNGSGGAILHSPEHLESSLDDWENKPIISYHPYKDNEYVPVNSLTTAKNDIIGSVMNVNYDEGLKAEAWLNADKLENKTPDLLQALESGQEIDVSIGVGSIDKEESGEWNGEAYTKITEVYTPDHLAILLDEPGACSIDDGCGLGVYSEGTHLIFEQKRDKKTKHITVNKEYRQFIREIDSIVSGISENAWTWVSEVYDEFFIYEYDPKDEEPLSYYRQYYTYTETDGVNLVGDPVEVVKNITYDIKVNKEVKPSKVVEVETNTLKGGDNMSCSCNADKASKIDTLIQANVGFSEADKEMLEGQDEKVIDYMLSDKGVGEVVTETNTEPATKEPKQTVESPTGDQGVVTQEVIVNALKSMDKDTLYSVVLSEEDQLVIKRGLTAYARTKEVLVGKLKDKVGAVYTAEQLEALDLDELERTAKLVGIDEIDSLSAYLGAGAPLSQVNTGVGDGKVRKAMMLPTDEFKKKEVK